MGGEAVEVVNRTDKVFKFSHGGISYQIPAFGSIHVDQVTADHARKKSIMSYDLETGKATYQVGTRHQHDVSKLGAGKTDEDELIDRETDPLGRPERINVRGGRATRDADDVLAR